ncbi:hypothetical protein AGMMS49975_00670 [Clostridia bacterium]|nr:hypothetical protein AGMMS49975_00670 [Clostridia bacterium]
MKILKLIIRYYRQLLFVFVAFVILISVSFYFVSGIVQRHLLRHGEEVTETAESNLRMVLSEAENALNGVTYTIEHALESGDDLRQLIETQNEWLKHTAPHMFSTQHAVYAIVDGEFYAPRAWVADMDYTVTKRPWYIGATANPNKVYFSMPYKFGVNDAEFGMSVSRELHDKHGKVRGVVGLDIDPKLIKNSVTGLSIAGSGYGVIINDKFEFVTHKQGMLVGHSMSVIDDMFADSTARLRGDLQRNGYVNAGRFTDYDGTESIVFFKRLFNGWYVGVVTEVAGFYADMYGMTVGIVVLGTVLLIIVSYLLIKLYISSAPIMEGKDGKTSFLTKMSHELRTPLNSIFGMTELALRDNTITHTIRDYVENIRKSSNSLLSLINDILDFSRIESGNLEVSEKEFQLSSLVGDVISIIRMKLLDSPVKFVVNVKSAIPDNLIGDEIRVRQVLINLLENAVKFTEKGVVSLDVSAELLEGNRLALIFDVTDTGIGIRPENIRKLFIDFVQFETVSGRALEGTGIGLSVSRKICIRLGGDIAAKSVYGAGSTFTARVVQSFASYDALASVLNYEGKRVLLYEPRKEYMDNMSKTLEDLGVIYYSTQDPSVFYEELKQIDYPYVFTAPYLFANVRNILNKLDMDSKIVLLSEFGEVITAKCNRIIEMPTYCVPVSNMLNDIIVSADYRDSVDTDKKFIAKSASVLIVDDIPTNLKIAEGLMSAYGMHIDTCRGGQECIDLVCENDYDIIFMDYMMPIMNGIEATEKIRELGKSNERLKNLRIVALTAVAAANGAEMFIHAGMDDFMAKPIEMPKLDAVLRKWIPEEKQERVKSVKEAQESGEGITIEGIDTVRGLHMSGGSLDAYVSVLAVFYKDCVEKIEELQTFVEKGDMKAYTSQVHALKSASANIGATRVSEFAKALEESGNKEDYRFIAENNDEFIQQLRFLLKNISPLLRQSNEDKTSDNTSTDDVEALKENFGNLKNALAEMDISKVDDIMKVLQDMTWSADVRDVLDKISHFVLMFEFDDAVSLIDETTERNGK